jgi:hypothetical protein
LGGKGDSGCYDSSQKTTYRGVTRPVDPSHIPKGEESEATQKQEETGAYRHVG